mmetsp:Transcript_40629/g.96235  ORF Transcript_40629/g.96235 Transcript_40629/m.96235 type:complete len:238 (-) Transcript_40629:99-812(-)
MDMAKRKDAGTIETVLRLAEEAGVTIEKVDKGRLNVMSGDRPHQGLVLFAEPLSFIPIKVLAAPEAVEEGGRPKVWLVLDEVMDPQNFGALLRSAYFLGCSGVVICAKNSANLSPSVSKASAGSMEAFEVHSTDNLMRFLTSSKENGWEVVGAALDQASVPAAKVSLDKPTLLVLGNEGRGLRTLVKRCCDRLVQIEGGGKGLGAASGVGGDDEDGDMLDSLNVSVAAGILLHRLLC